MNKLQYFEGTENKIKSQELKDKIYSLISGYTLK